MAGWLTPTSSAARVTCRCLSSASSAGRRLRFIDDKFSSRMISLLSMIFRYDQSAHISPAVGAATTVSSCREHIVDIQHNSILITGAGRGIGRAMVTEALRRGARRVYAGNRGGYTSEDKRVVPVALDVTHAAQIAAAARDIEELGALVNNAGVV